MCHHVACTWLFIELILPILVGYVEVDVKAWAPNPPPSCLYVSNYATIKKALHSITGQPLKIARDGNESRAYTFGGVARSALAPFQEFDWSESTVAELIAVSPDCSEFGSHGYMWEGAQPKHTIGIPVYLTAHISWTGIATEPCCCPTGLDGTMKLGETQAALSARAKNGDFGEGVRHFPLQFCSLWKCFLAGLWGTHT